MEAIASRLEAIAASNKKSNQRHFPECFYFFFSFKALDHFRLFFVVFFLAFLYVLLLSNVTLDF